MPDMARRGIFGSLSSVVKKKEPEIFYVRLPYNEDVSLFRQECPNCEDKPCVAVCEEEIIKVNEEGIPFLDFHASGCTFCEECAKACSFGVLSLKDDIKDCIYINVGINTNTCLAWNDVICSTCRDVCDERAVEFFGLMRPTVNKDKCTGCGFCHGVCPTYAVEISAIKGEAK